ncbi:MAG: DUF6427 family protein [Chitinophagales bacterium]|nr:DUF6427 family protein [Chitinophagales bacterium]OJV24251.1 MAG: hypothetical protein BGO32_04385 [Bacteroidetes bacterium 37-13]HRN93524.1 DUF6427 family protein [Chitinophagales bacterium]HRP39246.1 DUF6427 family protein [Chitinophagales bacterium]
MYRIFTLNSPLNLLFYAIVLLALQVAWWAQPIAENVVIEHAEPLSNLLFPKLQTLPNAKSVLQSLGLVLSLVIAIFLNNTIASNKILNSRSYTTGIFFIIFLSLVRHFGVLSPELISVYFSLRIIQKALRIVKEEKPFGNIFDLGWISALSVLFYFPSLWMLFFSFLILVVFRPFSLKEWLMVFIGFLAPFFFIFTLYFWFDKTHELLIGLTNLPNVQARSFEFSPSVIIAALVFVIAFLLSASALPRILFSNVIQVRKFVNLLLIMIALVLLSSFLQAEFTALHFSVLCLPLSILCAMYFQSLKGVFLSELLFGMLILSAVIVHFFK